MEKEVTRQEISDEILFELINRINASQNCSRIVIRRMELPFIPPRAYDIRLYVNSDIIEAAKLHDFVYRDNLSNDEEIVFDKK